MSVVLSQPALVLNKNWVAVATTSVQSALGLMVRGAAKAICTDTYEVYDFERWSELRALEGEHIVRTVTLELKVPRVILLTLYGKVPPRRVVFSRRNLYRRDSYTCQYCGCRPGSSELTIDHVVPVSQGGKTTWENCVLACVDCNFKKGGRTPRQAGMKLRSEPSRPRWSPRLALKIGELPESWEQFISRHYWNVELQSD